MAEDADDAGRVERIDVAAYTVPTDLPEADGTLAWDSTTVVVVQVFLRGRESGLGFAYGHPAMVRLIDETLTPHVVGLDARDTAATWTAMVRAIRNLGRSGLSSMAISAVDLAVWDAKARLLGQPLHKLLGGCRESVPIYGSGGFTTYSMSQLLGQLQGWVASGVPRVKMKIGTDWGRSWRVDVVRIDAVRKAIGDDTELFVDANGGYSRKQARRLGQRARDPPLAPLALRCERRRGGRGPHRGAYPLDPPRPRPRAEASEGRARQEGGEGAEARTAARLVDGGRVIAQPVSI